jgi:hypothetical protein
MRTKGRTLRDHGHAGPFLVQESPVSGSVQLPFS